MLAPSLHWWHVVALLGAVQSLVLAIPLLARRTNRTANRLLAAALATFAVHLTSVAYYGASLVERFPFFFGVGHPVPLLFGPLLYGYARAASDRAWRPSARHAWHLAPALLALLWSAPVFLLSGPDKAAMLRDIQRGAGPRIVGIVDTLKLVSGVAYATATLRLLRRHRAEMLDNYSSLDRVVLDWLRWLAWAGAAIWAIAVGFRVLEPLGIVPAATSDAVVAVAVTVLVYLVADRGLRQPEIFHFAPAVAAAWPVPASPILVSAAPAEEVGELEDAGRDEPSLAPAGESAPEPETLPDEGVEPVERAPGPARPVLSPRRARALESALRELMSREEPWRDPELTLGALAERLGTTTHKLSEVLNAGVRQSFYDFVNGYRVRDVERRLADPASASRTLVALALDAGFSSKSTFNAVFKRATGVTPTQYRAASEATGGRAPAMASSSIGSDV